jgi:radical SAM protein with 4Fe4S-binding SPASM domain
MSTVEDAISPQVLEDGFKGEKNPLDAVQDLFDMEDLTEDEAQMIRDWESRLLDLTPVLRIEEWKRTQRFLRKLLSQRESRGEDLKAFSQTASHIDQTGQLVSGRLQYKMLEYKAPHIWSTLQIPLTENCNLLCKHCPRTQKYLSKDIPFEDFQEYLSRFSPERFKKVLLSDFGEPFLRKDILRILRFVKERGFHNVEVVTTGNLMNENMRKTILDEGLLGKLMISIESATKDLYEDIRGSDFESMKECIGEFIKYRNQIGSKKPEVFFNAVCMKDNAHELPKIMDLAAGLGVDHVLFVHLNGIVSDFSSEERSGFEEKMLFSKNHLNACDPEYVKEIFSQVHEKSIEYGIGYLPPEEYLETQSPFSIDEFAEPWPEGSKCDRPYEWVQVQSGGNVYPCCQIAQRYSVGNVQDKSFEDVWNSPKFVEFREGLKNGNPNRWCEVCNVYNGKRF